MFGQGLFTEMDYNGVFFSSKSKKCVWDTNMTDSVARCSLRVKFLGGLRFTFFFSSDRSVIHINFHVELLFLFSLRIFINLRHARRYGKPLENHNSCYREYSHVLSATDSQLSLKEIDTWLSKKTLLLFICIIHSQRSALQICISSDIFFSTW